MKSIPMPAINMLDNPQNILIALLVPIGDSLLCKPVLQAFRSRFPDAHLTVLIPPVIQSIIQDFDLFDDVIVHPGDPLHNGWWNFFTTLRIIRERDFDCILSMSAYGNVYALFAGIPQQFWLNLPKAFWLLGALDPAYARRHATLHYWKIIESLQMYPTDMRDLTPTWLVNESDKQWARKYLQESGGDDRKFTIILHPGAEGYHGMKKWPAERFGALAQELLLAGFQVVVMGGKEDRPAGKVIQNMTGNRVITSVGNTTLKQSIALIAITDCFVGCDSGLSHFAAALETPLVVLFGATSLEQFSPHPIDSTRMRVVRPQPKPETIGYFIGTESILFCRHEYDKNTSMQRINVASVKNAILSLIPQFVVAHQQGSREETRV